MLGHMDTSGEIKQTPSAAVILKATHHWLSKKENCGWLLLVDNSDHAKVEELDKLIPKCDWGSVVVTTRVPNLTRFGESVEVGGIGPEAGLELLLKSLRKPLKPLKDFKLGEGNKIVETLAELPLALDQAGAYTFSMQIKLSDYRKKLEEGMNSAFRKGLSDPSLVSYKASVLTTWELSFQALHEDARRLLHLYAFLGNDDIPKELFRRGKKAVDWLMKDETKLEDAIENLFAFSLAKRKESNDSFWIHPLVHTWAREHNDITLQRKNAEHAIALVASAFVTGQHKRTSDDWIFDRRILTNVEVCQKNIADYFSGSEGIKIANSASAIASNYHRLGYYKQAEDSYRTALAIFEKALGSVDPSTLSALNNMARAFNRQGRYDEAVEWYGRALAGYEKALGSDHLSTLDIVNNMASVFDDQGWYGEAVEWYGRALAGKEKALGCDHPSTLGTVNNMVIVFDHQGRYAESLEWFQRALAGKEKALGKNHPSTLITVRAMVRVLNKLERNEEAKQLKKLYKL